jgi:hypothetical protein
MEFDLFEPSLLREKETAPRRFTEKKKAASLGGLVVDTFAQDDGCL